jgi:hypothetical protein
VPTFGIISEGPTDRQVIENIVLGHYDGHGEEPVFRPIQPPAPTAEDPAPPGGWTRVFDSLRRKDPELALQFSDYLIIQIDTDTQEETGFDVPRRDGGRELSLEERVERVIAKLVSYIDPTFYDQNRQRLLFAIAVEEVECWLLPLLLTGKKIAKTTGCLEAANRELRRKDRAPLSSGEDKDVRAYDTASREYLKRKTLVKHRDANPSLALFLQQLESRCPLSAAPPPTQAPDNQ